MPSAANVQRQMLARIAQSTNTITIVSPAARPITTGTAPGPAPQNPLYGAPATVTTTTPDPTPEAAPVTVKCLWYDLLGTGDSRHNPANLVEGRGWVADSDAVALVALSDVTIPTGTLFDACDHVEARGQHFVVLSVIPSGPAFTAPYLCYVWVKGARKQ